MTRFMKIAFLFLIMISFSKIQAQNISAISIAIASANTGIFETDILPRYRAANPDTLIEIRTISPALLQDLSLPSSQDIIGSYFDAIEQLANLADVLIIPPGTLNPESTRTSHLLDLAPLLRSDSSMNPDDFIPSAWSAFQWDGGQWAIPATIAPQVMVYEPDAFDAAGLSYPATDWTLEDYVSAATVFAENGQAGLFVPDSESGTFMYLLTGQNFSTNEITPQPDFVSSETEAFISEWQSLLNENIVTNQFANDIPMRMMRFINVANNDDLQATLINGQAAIDLFSIAISNGTHNRELAYHFASFLSTAPEMTALYPTSIPARYSVNTDIEDTISEDKLDLHRAAIDNAVSPSALIFGNYLSLALHFPGDDTVESLQMSQSVAEEALSVASERRDNRQVDVIPPENAELPESTEVIIDFAVMTNSGSGMTNRSNLWENAIEEFLTINPDIDGIDLNAIAPLMGYRDELASHTCIFNFDYSLFFDIEDILPLDPLIQADPTFDETDMIGDIMQDMRLNGMTYTLPHAISAVPIMQYDRELFATAGLPEPDSTWTVSEFIDTLQQLDVVTEGAPLDPYTNSTAILEMLMAGFGAAPIDYTTDPPTPHLTDEPVIAAIQNTLDIAKNGLSNYTPAATFFGFARSPETVPAISVQSFNFGENSNLEHYGYVNFPDGVDTTPVRFFTSQSFIFADEQHPEACYRWLRTISSHPELFNGIPVFYSVINSDTTRAIYGDSGIATFQDVAARLEAPDRVLIGNMGGGVNMFLGRAFDRYVLEDADLVSELELAQQYITEFYDCADGINLDIFDCIDQVDPTLFELIEDRILPAEYKQ